MKNYFPILFLLILYGWKISAQISPQDAIRSMQKGINLGNTLEPPQEGGWNNPKAQEYYFDLYKEAGFDCVRIPVRWDEHTGLVSPYKIDAVWMTRVEQIVDWGLSRGLFIIINAHHEEWIKANYSQINRDRFDSIWSQISVRFRNKSDRLLFEIINEPYGLTKAQNDDLHLRVLQVIRKTNPARNVIFQGHNWGGSDELIVANIPADNHLIGSFHSYDPYTFGLLGEGKWGSSGDIALLRSKFQTVKDWSDKYKIPVILGEFGSLKSCDYNSRMKHYKTYVELSQLFGFSACAWDDGGDFQIMLRSQKTWNEIKDILIYCSPKSPVNPALQIFRDSIIRLTWTNIVADCDSLCIERRTTSSSYRQIASLAPNASTFDDIKPVINLYYHYRIIARYKDTAKVPIYSNPVQIYFPAWVKRVRTPFPGHPATLPGVIEAEDFDSGGEGFTYHDTETANLARAYRPTEGVDIYDRNGKGYHIGNALPGEWYEYSVYVETGGTYKADFELASLQGGGSFQIQIGDSMSDTLKAPVTYSALTTKTVSSTIDLHQGNQILRFSILGSPLFNIDKMRFELLTGIRDIQKEPGDMFVYSDPGHSVFIVDLKGERCTSALNLYDITGNIVFSTENPGTVTRIPVSGLKPGLYFIRTTIRHHPVVKKIMCR